MFFSIIIPVYNVEAWLARAVDSLLAQSAPGLCEVILIDDGSTDSSGSICDEYAARYSFIRVVHKPNGGQSSARNTGLDMATGEYVIFLDSDDTLQPDALQIFYDFLRENRVDVLRYGTREISDGRVALLGGNLAHNAGKVLDAETYLQTSVLGPEVCTVVCRREFLDRFQIRFRTGIIHEDNLFSATLSVHSQKIAQLNYHGYNYIRREGSCMGNPAIEWQEKRISDGMTVLEELQKLRPAVQGNLVKSENHERRIALLAFFVFRLLAESSLPRKRIQIQINRLGSLGGYPFAPASSSAYFRFYRMLSLLHFPLGLLIAIHRIFPTSSFLWNFAEKTKNAIFKILRK